MKPNSDTLLRQLLQAFNDQTQKRHPQHAPLIKCIEMALIDYHYDERVLYPNWLEWLVSTNNALHTRIHQGYSVESIQYVHELLRDRLAHYDKSVKKVQNEHVNDVNFMVEYGFHDSSRILEQIHQVAPNDKSVSNQKAATSEFPTLSPDNRSNMSLLRRFSFLPPAASSMSSKMPASLSLGNG